MQTQTPTECYAKLVYAARLLEPVYGEEIAERIMKIRGCNQRVTSLLDMIKMLLRRVLETLPGCNVDRLISILELEARIQQARNRICRARRGDDVKRFLKSIGDDVKRLVAEALSREKRSLQVGYCRGGVVEEGVVSVSSLAYRVEAELETLGFFGLSTGPLYRMFEVGIAWDPLLDIPYLPGTSIKGALRSLLILSCLTLRKGRVDCLYRVYRLFGLAGDLRGEEEVLDRLEQGERDVLYERLRSAVPQGSQGCLAFTDLYPVRVGREGRLLEPTVITPHYRGADIVESEYDAQPNPILHVAVAPGVVFRGCIYIPRLPACNDASKMLVELMRLLGVKASDATEALGVMLAAAGRRGVGARTSRGYSRFRFKLEPLKTR